MIPVSYNGLGKTKGGCGCFIGSCGGGQTTVGPSKPVTPPPTKPVEPTPPPQEGSGQAVG